MGSSGRTLAGQPRLVGRATGVRTLPDSEGVEAALLDRNGVIVAVNQAWQDFSRSNGGDPNRTGVGMSYLAVCDAVAGDPLARHMASAIRAAIRGDLPAPILIRIPCHSPTTERWFDVNVCSRLDDWGVCAGAVVTISPAPVPSAPILAELTGSAAWRAFDLVPDPVFVLDADVRVEYANPATLALLGYAAEDLIGLALSDLDPETDLASARSDLDLITGPGSMRVMACELHRQDGSRVPVEAHVRSTEDPAGVRRFVVVAHDLRPRRAQGALLRAGEDSFRVAFECAPVGMAVLQLDADGRHSVLRANHALADLLGEDVDHLIGRDLSDFSAPAASRLRSTSNDDGTTPRAYSSPMMLRRLDGDLRRAQVRVTHVEFPGAATTAQLAHILDVTEEYETERQRNLDAGMSAAVAAITTKVLKGGPQQEVYQLIVDSTAQVFDAENVTLGLPDPVTGLLRAAAAVGPASTLLLTGKVPVSQEFAQRLIQLGAVAMPEPEPDVHPELRPLLGPAAATRFGGPDASCGLLTVARHRGGEPFTDAEVTALSALAQQVALAVELGQARADQQRLAVLEDRQRIARDLHDTVIQDLIAVGMQLDAALQREADPRRHRRDTALIDQLEEAVRRLRGSVFDLRRPAGYATLPDAVHSVVAEAARVLGHTPSVRMECVDDVPNPIADAVVAVMREGLSNVARHAHATRTSVTLTVDASQVWLAIEDDGCGLPDTLLAGDGITNISQRAAALCGQAAVEPGPTGGTRLTWSCPLPHLRGGSQPTPR